MTNGPAAGAFAAMSAGGAVVAPLIDHTLLRPEATRADVARLCVEARHYGFAAVCVNPRLIEAAAAGTCGSRVAACTVIGFPLGADPTELKAHEAERLAALGAVELDMVLAIGELKERRYDAVRHDIAQVVRAAAGRCVKVILETHLLTDDEKRTACRLAVEAGARFVKTTTGFTGGGATEADVRLMREAVGDRAGVKASGGIRTLAQAEAIARAGASRIGTSSGVAIVTGA